MYSSTNLAVEGKSALHVGLSAKGGKAKSLGDAGLLVADNIGLENLYDPEQTSVRNIA